MCRASEWLLKTLGAVAGLVGLGAAGATPAFAGLQGLADAQLAAATGSGYVIRQNQGCLQYHDGSECSMPCHQIQSGQHMGEYGLCNSQQNSWFYLCDSWPGHTCKQFSKCFCANMKVYGEDYNCSPQSFTGEYTNDYFCYIANACRSYAGWGGCC